MATKITMPQLGESVTEGTISKWLVEPGDEVKKYDPIAEVMTDKVNAEVPSSYAGKVIELVAQEDETVAVGDVIMTMAVEGGEQDTSKVIKEGSDKKVSKEEPKEEEKSMKKRYSPAVLRLAQEHDIDLARVEGTGRGGRITRKDLEKLIQEGVPTQSEPPVSESEEKTVKSTDTNVETAVSPQEQDVHQGDKRIPVNGVRKAIADNMVKSKQEIPHAWTMVEVDVTNLMRYREKEKARFEEREGFKLTPLPFFMKATVEALKEFPQVNAIWGGDEIIQKQNVHLSVAVATEEALYVPVIHHADEKSVKGLAKNVHDLAGAVRSNSIRKEQMQGGTFTINNTGSFGSVLSQPIINAPQAAILSVESIVKRPVVVNGDSIAIRDMVNICLSLDHRILDGLVAGRFLQRIKDRLEQIDEQSMSIY
ncbi:dihydrolipoamide acetyltransferase family protein [Texcoconibacillus texcoconensis]|uniref:Dihydrolipoamide acetyltransferase component of pyruvate dehydrogenase complex n=1 Tax=Texcoconibacillus texcoconensis TaxID=1095777 RepID=A0A840QNX6_9BACI|nr:dihydrolipoamide acetyltransferase family protein [Texcoconibacillus texcoconensis]MBB5173043.1 2-oxoisovalerate dehydrogenase E2 component (dihydrolipoyl transacylase) [Texcoconibacillus texcoconensis]